jgi:hypothetical protein
VKWSATVDSLRNTGLDCRVTSVVMGNNGDLDMRIILKWVIENTVLRYVLD